MLLPPSTKEASKAKLTGARAGFWLYMRLTASDLCTQILKDGSEFMRLSADANVPTAVAIELQESIRHDGGIAATVGGDIGDLGGTNERRKIYLKVFDDTALTLTF